MGSFESGNGGGSEIGSKERLSDDQGRGSVGRRKDDFRLISRTSMTQCSRNKLGIWFFQLAIDRGDPQLSLDQICWTESNISAGLFVEIHRQCSELVRKFWSLNKALSDSGRS
jgi:hypothetical protein